MRTSMSPRKPVSKPSNEFTASTYLYLSRSTLQLRSELCSLLNDTLSELSHDQVLEYSDQIATLVEELPSCKVGREGAVRAMLEIQLQQYVLLLHFRFLQQPSSRPKRNYSAF